MRARCLQAVEAEMTVCNFYYPVTYSKLVAWKRRASTPTCGTIRTAATITAHLIV